MTDSGGWCFQTLRCYDSVTVLHKHPWLPHNVRFTMTDEFVSTVSTQNPLQALDRGRERERRRRIFHHLSLVGVLGEFRKCCTLCGDELHYTPHKITLFVCTSIYHTKRLGCKVNSVSVSPSCQISHHVSALVKLHRQKEEKRASNKMGVAVKHLRES